MSPCSFGRGARDGEHRPFNDAHHGLARENVAVPGELGYEAAQHLGEDDPGVTASPHQRAVRDGLTHVGHVGVLGEGAEFGRDRFDREGHIGPGVTVGDRIDIEAIDDILVGTQQFRVRTNRRTQFACGQRQRRGHR